MPWYVFQICSAWGFKAPWGLVDKKAKARHSKVFCVVFFLPAVAQQLLGPSENHMGVYQHWVPRDGVKRQSIRKPAISQLVSLEKGTLA